MYTTPNFGFGFFDDSHQGSITDNAGQFTGKDRLLMDTLFGATIYHDHHYNPSASVTPQSAPSVVAGVDGTLPPGSYTYKVGFVDSTGLETLPSGEATVTTTLPLSAPGTPSPSTTFGGSLAAGPYMYALTAVRGANPMEESVLGDSGWVTVVAPDQSVVLSIPDLGSADGYWIWRMAASEAGPSRIAKVTSSGPWTDTGAIASVANPLDPNNRPPQSNSGVSTYSVTVTLSDADAVNVQSFSSWRLYRTTTPGSYASSSLVHEVVERTSETAGAPLETSWTDTGDYLLAGSPTTRDTRMQFSPYVIEPKDPLPSAAGYPTGYPVMNGTQLYVAKDGVWLAVSMDSSQNVSTPPLRQTMSITTPSIANSVDYPTMLTMGTVWRLYKVTTNVPARVRIYATESQQTADLSRAFNTTPTGDHGVLLDMETSTGMLSKTLTPVVMGASMELNPLEDISVTVTNISGSSASVVATFVFTPVGG